MILAKLRRITLLVLTFTGPPALGGSMAYLDYFDDSPGELPFAVRQAFEQICLDVDRRQFNEANQRFEDILGHLDTLAIDPRTGVKLLANGGLVRAANDDQASGMTLINQAVDDLEAFAGPYDAGLVAMLIPKGLIHYHMGDYVLAEDALRRAQHIAQRHDGVYAKDQLPIIDHLTDLYLAQGSLLNADREQRLSLTVSEAYFGAESEELVAALEKLGAYFSGRGGRIPSQSRMKKGNYGSDVADSAERHRSQTRRALLGDAVSLYERALQILEAKYGRNDLSLVHPLNGLAEVWLNAIQARGKGKRLLKRALAIVEASPDADATDHVHALVALGDAYTLSADPTRATAHYKHAWAILSGRPELTSLRDALFSSPTRLTRASPEVLWVTHVPPSANPDRLYAELAYSVTADGRVAKPRVTDANISDSYVNVLLKQLRDIAFRPRFIDGEPTTTDNLALHQDYQYQRPEGITKFTLTN